jgi:hypothetical protein
MRVDDGYNPTIYGWVFDETINSDSRKNSAAMSVYGHLIFDEIKLKSGMCVGGQVTTRTTQPCGFVFLSNSSTLSLTNSIRDMLLQSKQG